jgi:hypothetical protein
MARKRKGKIVRAIRAGIISAEEGRRTLASHYNEAVPTFSKHWYEITPTKGPAWADAMGTLLGGKVKPEYPEKYSRKVKEIADKKLFEKFVAGKGETLVKRMGEKLVGAVAG